MKSMIMIALAFTYQTSEAFEYFENGIEYWQQPAASKEEKSTPQHLPAKPFNWSKHLDPKNEEFFKEGDYKPPEPFMELIRNPTDKNIKNWFALMDKKNKLAARLQARMKEYALKKQSGLKPNEQVHLTKVVFQPPLGTPPTDYKRYRFRLYFHSACPHCQKMIGTMKHLYDRGFYVEIAQIDKARLTQPIPFVIRPATANELAEKNIKAWPVLFVGDLKKEIVYRINGYHHAEKILEIVRKKGGL